MRPIALATRRWEGGDGRLQGPRSSSPPYQPIRPRALPLATTGDGQSTRVGVSRRNRVGGMAGMTLGKMEGSATSDEVNEESHRNRVGGMAGITVGKMEGSATSDEVNEESQPRYPFPPYLHTHKTRMTRGKMGNLPSTQQTRTDHNNVLLV
jgi:hypothetical protein